MEGEFGDLGDGRSEPQLPVERLPDVVNRRKLGCDELDTAQPGAAHGANLREPRDRIVNLL